MTTITAISSDNKYIVSGSKDGPIRIWDLQKFIKQNNTDNENPSSNNTLQDDENLTSTNTSNDTESSPKSTINTKQTNTQDLSSSKNSSDKLISGNPGFIVKFFIGAILICGGGWWIYDNILRELLFPSSIE